jgi:HSP20 family protein
MAKKKDRRTRDEEETEESESLQALGGWMGGLGNLLEKLGDLAERGEELHRLQELHGKPVRGVVGFSIKTALGDRNRIKVEPFGNVSKDKRTGRVAVQEVNEPMVDIFDEAHKVLVVAEMPGVAEADVELQLQDDILTISAEKGRKKYRKEVLLPSAFSSGQMSHSCRNGVLEVELTK